MGDERAETGELDGGGSVHRDRDLARRVGEMVAEAVVKRLDRVADGMGVEEVDQEPVSRLPACAHCVHASVGPADSDASRVAQNANRAWITTTTVQAATTIHPPAVHACPPRETWLA